MLYSGLIINPSNDSPFMLAKPLSPVMKNFTTPTNT
jgi:hypothetical protein